MGCGVHKGGGVTSPKSGSGRVVCGSRRCPEAGGSGPKAGCLWGGSGGGRAGWRAPEPFSICSFHLSRCAPQSRSPCQKTFGFGGRKRWRKHSDGERAARKVPRLASRCLPFPAVPPKRGKAAAFSAAAAAARCRPGKKPPRLLPSRQTSEFRVLRPDRCPNPCRRNSLPRPACPRGMGGDAGPEAGSPAGARPSHRTPRSQANCLKLLKIAGLCSGSGFLAAGAAVSWKFSLPRHFPWRAGGQGPAVFSHHCSRACSHPPGHGQDGAPC